MALSVNLNDFLAAQIQKQKKKEPSLVEGLQKVADGIVHNIRISRAAIANEEKSLKMDIDSLCRRKASAEKVADALAQEMAQLKSEHTELQERYAALSNVDKEPELRTSRLKYFGEAAKALRHIDQEQMEHRTRSEIVCLCASKGVIVVRDTGSYTLCLRDRPDLKTVVVKAQENLADDKAAIEEAVEALCASAAQTPRAERVRARIYDPTGLPTPNTSVVITALEDDEENDEMDASEESIDPQDTATVIQENNDIVDSSATVVNDPRQTALAGLLDYSDNTESTFTSDC